MTPTVTPTEEDRRKAKAVARTYSPLLADDTRDLEDEIARTIAETREAAEAPLRAALERQQDAAKELNTQWRGEVRQWEELANTLKVRIAELEAQRAAEERINRNLHKGVKNRDERLRGLAAELKAVKEERDRLREALGTLKTRWDSVEAVHQRRRFLVEESEGKQKEDWDHATARLIGTEE